MLVAVTGAAGFLGASLVERLILQGGTEVRCLVRASTRRDHLEALRVRYPEAKISYVAGSLLDPGAASAAVAGADVVYHLAAGMRGGPADIYLDTVVASRNLLDAVVAHGVPRVVTISSLGVYGVAELPRGAVVNEDTPIEPHPGKRDAYSFAKLRQERLFHDYQKAAGFQLVVLRPGVIYGPRGGLMSSRVGVQFPGFFMLCGGSNRLPLTYVDNCADAVLLAGSQPHPTRDEAYNVVDDDLPTCRQYLRQYRLNVERMRTIGMPYAGVMLLSRFFTWYNTYSKGQLPAFLTPYKSANLWKGNRFENRKIKALGWQPRVPLDEGLKRTFEHFKQEKKVQ